MGRLLIVSLIAAVGLASIAVAGDAAKGKAKSVACAACHGPNGISLTPMFPNIAGQKELYLVKQIKAFRDGQRVDLMMSPMVKVLTDEDIADLASYYANIK